MLPGRKGRPHATHKVSVGYYDPDKGAPAKDDHFTVRRFDRDLKRWVVNEELQERLQEKLTELGAKNPQKPDWVPVLTPYTTPQDAVFSEMAMWAAGRYVCHCSRFALKDAATIREQGLAWPIPGGEENAGAEYYVGAARRVYWRKKGKAYACTTEAVTCDPATCPFSRMFREDDMAEYKAVYGKPNPKAIGTTLCKPHVVVPLILPWVGSESPRAKFCTAAWSSGKTLERTLEEIHDATGGVLCGIPLRLTLTFQHQQHAGGAHWNPLVQFEPTIDWEQLALIGGEQARMLADNVEAQTRVNAQLKMLKGVVAEDAEDVAQGVAWQQEFGAGITEPEPFAMQTERRYYELAVEAGQTRREAERFYEGATDSEVGEQIRAFEEQLGISDAEFEEPEEEVASPKPLDLSPDEPGEDPFPESPESQAKAANATAKVDDDGQTRTKV